LLEGPFNDIHNWAYHKVPEVLGTGMGLEIRTVEELDAGLQKALANTSSFSLLNVHLDSYDRSPALARLTSRLSKLVDSRSKS
jgi:indolepyruvate decarboxylase